MSSTLSSVSTWSDVPSDNASRNWPSNLSSGLALFISSRWGGGFRWNKNVGGLSIPSILDPFIYFFPKISQESQKTIENTYNVSFR